MVRYTSALMLFGLTALAGLGCHGLKRPEQIETAPLAVKAPPKPPPPAGTAPERVIAMWEKQVQFGTNPVTNQPIAGLSGRVYLFEKNPGYSLNGTGDLTVELYDDTQHGDGKPSKMIEHWDISAELLAKMVQTDRIGQGYTLKLPWSSYDPSINQVHLNVRFTPKSGQPLEYADKIMTLERNASPIQVASFKTPALTAGAK